MRFKSKLLSALIFTIMALSLSAPLSNSVYAKTDKTKTPVAQVESKTKKEKKESQNVLVKFLITMLWVAGSCGAIFLILLAYKKLSGAKFANPKHIEMSKNLNSPETEEEAAKLFIEKF